MVDPINSLEATAPKMVRICSAEDGEVFPVRLHTLSWDTSVDRQSRQTQLSMT